jgi:hypothetical protein
LNFIYFPEELSELEEISNLFTCISLCPYVSLIYLYFSFPALTPPQAAERRREGMEALFWRFPDFGRAFFRKFPKF